MTSRIAGRYWFGHVGPSGYGFHATAEKIASDNADKVRGKVVLVTGAATGVGFETARVFAKFGATVFVTARSLDKANKAADAIRALVPDANLKTLALDLSSLKDVKRAADEFLALKSPLHLLINNAGIMAPPFATTADGIESQFGTNHIGHFVLSVLLLPALKTSAPSRVVTLSSLAHAWTGDRKGVVYPGPLDVKETYSAWPAYGRSKLASVYFARGFNQRYAADGVTAYSLHPGNIATELARNLGVFGSISNAFARMIGKTIPEGAATTMFCALSDKAVPGEYHDESNVDMDGAHPLFRDQGQVDALWATSEKIMREKLGA